MSMRIRRPVDAAGPEPSADPAARPAGPDEAPASATSRRRFMRNVGLGAAAVGAATVAGPALAQTASAQTTSNGVDLPQGDVQIATFIQGLELAAMKAYTDAAADKIDDNATAQLFRNYAAHHQAAADAVGGLLSSDQQVTTPNKTLLGQLDDMINGARDQVTIIKGMSDMENRLAATQYRDVGLVESYLLVRQLTKILAVEQQQGAMLAQSSGTPVTEWMPVGATDQGAYTAAQYPAS